MITYRIGGIKDPYLRNLTGTLLIGLYRLQKPDKILYQLTYQPDGLEQLTCLLLLLPGLQTIPIHRVRNRTRAINRLDVLS